MEDGDFHEEMARRLGVSPDLLSQSKKAELGIVLGQLGPEFVSALNLVGQSNYELELERLVKKYEDIKKVEMFYSSGVLEQFIKNYDEWDRPTVLLFGLLQGKELGEFQRKFNTTSGPAEMASFFKPESGMERKGRMEEYFHKHNKEYNQENRALTHSVRLQLHDKGFGYNLDGVKTVVAIAAMGETDIHIAIEKIKESYGETFEKEVVVVVFHNYRGDERDISIEVQQSIDKVKAMANTAVVDKSVPEEFRVGSAKKYVSDIAIRLIGGRDIRVAMMDADIKGLSRRALQKARGKIGKADKLVASPEFDYDPRIKKETPLLGLLFDLRLEIVRKVIKKSGGTIRGMFYMIDPNTLSLIGGIKPTHAYEDVNLDQEIRSFYHVIFKTRYPGVKYDFLSTMSTNDLIVMGGEREKDSLGEGWAMWGRWNDEGIYKEQTRDARRGKDLATLPIDQGFEINSNNFCRLMNDSAPFLITKEKGETPSKALFQKSEWIYVALKRKKIKLTSYTIKTDKGLTLSGEEARKFLVPSINKGKWYFVSIESADLSNYKVPNYVSE